MVTERFIKHILSRKVLPCPLCKGLPFSRDGKTGCVWVGTISGSTQGVRCSKCKLGVEEPAPDKWPKGGPTKLKGQAKFEWLYRRMLKAAIERWNRLPRNP